MDAEVERYEGEIERLQIENAKLEQQKKDLEREVGPSVRITGDDEKGLEFEVKDFSGSVLTKAIQHCFNTKRVIISKDQPEPEIDKDSTSSRSEKIVGFVVTNQRRMYSNDYWKITTKQLPAHPQIISTRDVNYCINVARYVEPGSVFNSKTHKVIGHIPSVYGRTEHEYEENAVFNFSLKYLTLYDDTDNVYQGRNIPDIDTILYTKGQSILYLPYTDL
jgi:hypothetical protein